MTITDKWDDGNDYDEYGHRQNDHLDFLDKELMLWCGCK